MTSRNKYPYLQDFNFLKYFDGVKLKTMYVKIIVLDSYERPLNEIQGIVSGGSLNLDGNSSVRRTGNLTALLPEAENDFTDLKSWFSINKKITIEVGFENNTQQYTEYDILWFPCGLFVIGSASFSHGGDGVAISLQLKDKMSFLNGDCGGTIPAATTFHEYETLDANGEYVILQPTIYQIIQEAVNHFGGEDLSKIIIDDVDLRIKKVMKWTGSTPVYICESVDKDTGDKSYIFETDINKAESSDYVDYRACAPGEDVGYIFTDFTYPGELIGDAGTTVCDLLDKIKSTLGNYEYFYDVDGYFHFQEIKNYLNTSKSTVDLNNIEKGDYLIDRSKGKAAYVFEDGEIITSYSNNPNYSMIKNDYIVWGERTDVDGNKFPIRYHLAIDSKPKIGNSYQVFVKRDPTDNLLKAKMPIRIDSKEELPIPGEAEIFYIDKNDAVITWSPEVWDYVSVGLGLKTIVTNDWRTELYLSGATLEPLGVDSNYYYTELKNEWPKLYDYTRGVQIDGEETKIPVDENGNPLPPDFFDEVKSKPYDIDFFLDFIDTGAPVSELSVGNIGRRTKVIVDDEINCVFEPEIPDIVVLPKNGGKDLEKLREECQEQGQDYTQVENSIYNLIAPGGNHNSAFNMVRELLCQYTSYNESITISTLPIYYLEPNVRITIKDPVSGISGDYMINSISLPLDISSTMTINCTRALERI